MKKALFIIAAAAMFILAGCRKEQSLQESKTNDIIHINVGQITPATKVAAVDIDATKLSFSFEKGDQVAFINFTTMEITTFTCSDPTTGAFSGTKLDPNVMYMVYYPASCVDYLMSTDGYPENYRTKQIPKEHIIGTSEDVSGASTNFTLDRHFALIHFQLKGNAKIGSIEYQPYNESDKKYEDAATTLYCGEGVQLSDTPTDFYMDIARSSYAGFRLVFKDTSGNELGEQKSILNLNGKDVKGKMVDFNEALTVNTTPAAEPLKGVFTVSPGPDGREGTDDDVKVRFAKGNLYCKRSSSESSDWTWGIYEHQYDCNSLNASISQWDAQMGGSRTATANDTEIDLFTWGVGDWSTSPTTSSYLETPSVGNVLSGNEEWGSKIGNGWRTLTCDEFKYVLNTRTNASNKRKAGVSICGVQNCMLVAPDECLNDYSFDKNRTTYSEEDWKTAEAAGILCLPTTGTRTENKVNYVRGMAQYWTSTSVSKEKASAPLQIIVNQITLSTDGATNKNNGSAVRLAKDVQSE